MVPNGETGIAYSFARLPLQKSGEFVTHVEIWLVVGCVYAFQSPPGAPRVSPERIVDPDFPLYAIASDPMYTTPLEANEVLLSTTRFAVVP